MKILYASDNRPTSKNNLDGFLYSLSLSNRKDIEVKVAAYASYYDKCYWNLESLLNFSKPDADFSIKNSNYQLFKNEIKNNKPDMIISDLEPYTSLVALDLNITLYQLSPLCLYHALDKKDKDKLKIKQFYYHLWESRVAKNNCVDYIIKNSNLNIIVSSLLGKYDMNINDNFIALHPDQDEYSNVLDQQTSLYASVNKYLNKNNIKTYFKLSKFLEKI